MKTGKLPPELLSKLLQQLPADSRLILGPGIGLDAAAIDLGNGRVLVVATDPITFATHDIGRYAVHVNANDVACLGAQPRWFVATALLPADASSELAESIFEQIRTTCGGLGVTLVGGHTEITAGLDRPIISGTMFGETSLDELAHPKHARTGDHILLTQGIAIEGTALLAREATDTLLERGVDKATIAAAVRLLDNPGLSIVRDAQTASSATPVHALHDPTEGGIATALLELAEATGHELHIRVHDIPVLGPTRLICEALGLDPLGLLASGALLIVVDAGACDSVAAALGRNTTTCACIGELASAGSTAIIDQNGHPLPRFERDEVARFFDTLKEEGASEVTRPSGDTQPHLQA